MRDLLDDIAKSYIDFSLFAKSILVQFGELMIEITLILTSPVWIGFYIKYFYVEKDQTKKEL